jgi:hypothetical protein
MRTHYSIWAEVHDSMVHEQCCDACGGTRSIRLIKDKDNGSFHHLCGQCAKEQETENEDESN